MPDYWPPYAHTFLDEPPPAGACGRHGLKLVVIQSQYIRQAQGVECWHVCLRCALEPDAGGPDAVYQSGSWHTGSELASAFRAAWLETAIDPLGTSGPGADAVWTQIARSAPRQASEQQLLRAWAYCLRFPDADPSVVYQLLVKAEIIYDRDRTTTVLPDPMDQRPDELSGFVNGSRERWMRFTSSVWRQLAPSTRDALAALAPTITPRSGGSLDWLPAPAIDDLNAVLDGKAHRAARPTGGELSAWGRRVNDYRDNDYIRALACYAVLVHHPVPEINPLVDPSYRPRFGPRTPELEQLLRTAMALTEVQRACLRQASLDRWRERENGDGPHDHMSKAHMAVTNAYHRKQLDGAAWNVYLAFRDLVGDDLPLEAALTDAQLSVMAEGMIPPELAQAFGRTWRAGIQAAETIASDGRHSEGRLLELAPGWPEDLPSLVEAARAH